MAGTTSRTSRPYAVEWDGGKWSSATLDRWNLSHPAAHHSLGSGNPLFGTQGRFANRPYPGLECGSEAAALEFRRKGGSFAAALQSAPRIFMVSGCPSADGHERLF